MNTIKFIIVPEVKKRYFFLQNFVRNNRGCIEVGSWPPPGLVCMTAARQLHPLPHWSNSWFPAVWHMDVCPLVCPQPLNHCRQCLGVVALTWHCPPQGVWPIWLSVVTPPLCRCMGGAAAAGAGSGGPPFSSFPLSAAAGARSGGPPFSSFPL